MSGELSQEYVVARRTLLDALGALGSQCEAVVLVGAQAIYVHTGDAGLAVAEHTTDSDLALNPAKLSEDPELTEAMSAAGFYREENNNGPVVGIWSSLREIDGVPARVSVDLLVPSALGGGGSRAARLKGHVTGSAIKVAGIEGCLIDCKPQVLGSLESEDSRSFEIMVAGPSSLLVSKAIKLWEREEDVTKGRRDRRSNKDALDVLRILRAIGAAELAEGLELLLRDELSAEVTKQALSCMPALFGTPASPGSIMAADVA